MDDNCLYNCLSQGLQPILNLHAVLHLSLILGASNIWKTIYRER